MSDSYIKDPGARLDYTWDWADWLATAGDTMSTATVILPEGLTAAESPVVDAPFVTQKVSGGTLGVTYRMVCQITTGGGLIDRKSIHLTILDQ